MENGSTRTPSQRTPSGGREQQNALLRVGVVAREGLSTGNVQAEHGCAVRAEPCSTRSLTVGSEQSRKEIEGGGESLTKEAAAPGVCLEGFQEDVFTERRLAMLLFVLV